jgi:thiosulfate dehydrogenase
LKAEKRFNLILMALGLVLAAFTFNLSTVSGQEQIPGNPERGGQLYAGWDKVIGMEKLPEPQPLWPGSSNNQFPNRYTWRCSNCHGWDYLGSDGNSLIGLLKAQGYPGLLSLMSDPPEEIILWLDGTNNSEHDFSTYLSEEDLSDLSAFISTGLVSPELIADPGTYKVQGTLKVGLNVFQQYCLSCHGNEGEKINFGSTSTPGFMGDLAQINPWRISHIVRFGHTSTNVPPASKVELSFSQQIDLLAYLQTLPGARVIASPEIQQIDFSSQASTLPLVYGAAAISGLIFAAVIITQHRRR